MTKFFKVKGTEIRRAVEVDDLGNKGKVVAIIGQVKELLEKEIIFEDNANGNLDKWLVIPADNPDNIREFETLDDAKDSVR